MGISAARNLRLLAWFNFCLDFRLYGPVIILYFSRVAGSYTLGMSVFAITQLASAVFEVPTGVFSDWIGRKRTLIIGAGAGTLSIICYALGSYEWLVVGAIAEGFARALFSGNNNALLYDTLTQMGRPDEYQEYLGRVGSMFQVALAISAIIGSMIAFVSFSLVMWLSVIPQFLCLLLGLFMVEPTVHDKRSDGNLYAHLGTAIRLIFRNHKLRTISLASMLGFAFGESAFQMRSAFINLLWPVWAIGIAQTISNITAAFSFYLSGPIIKRFGELRLLLLGDGVSISLNTIALAVPTVLSPVLMGATSIFFGVNMVAKDGLMQREFSQEQRATMGSLTALGGSLAFGGYSLFLGAMADRFGVTAALLFTEFLSVFVILLYIIAFRQKNAVYREAS